MLLQIPLNIYPYVFLLHSYKLESPDWVCTSFLLPHNKLPQIQLLEAICIYYLTVSIRWVWVKWVLCSGSHKTTRKVSSGMQSHLETRLGQDPPPSSLRQNSFSSGCGTKVSFSFWLLVQGPSQLLEVPTAPIMWPCLHRVHDMAACSFKGNRYISLPLVC